MVYKTTKTNFKEYIREKFNNLSSLKREYKIVRVEDSVKLPVSEISNILTIVSDCKTVYKLMTKLFPKGFLKNFKNEEDEEVIKDLISMLREKGNTEVEIVNIEEKLGDAIVFMSELKE